MAKQTDHSPDNSDINRRKRPAKRRRSAKSGQFTKETDAATTVSEALAAVAFKGWVIYDPKGRVHDRTVFMTCAAAWNMVESQTGLARAGLHAEGYEVRKVIVLLKAR